jgi:hypothetical protein
MTQGNSQWSKVDGTGNHVLQSGGDAKVRHLGDKNTKNSFSFKGLGLAVLGFAVVGGGGVATYAVVAGNSVPLSEAVGTWELKASPGSVADMPATLTVSPDGAFDLRMKIRFNLNFPDMGGVQQPGIPQMELNCAGTVTPTSGRLAFTTTAGTCGPIKAEVHDQRIDLFVDTDHGEQVTSMVKTMGG